MYPTTARPLIQSDLINTTVPVGFLEILWILCGIRPNKQEAQLSLRDRAMLHVIEYFAKSLKITQGHSK